MTGGGISSRNIIHQRSKNIIIENHQVIEVLLKVCIMRKTKSSSVTTVAILSTQNLSLLIGEQSMSNEKRK